MVISPSDNSRKRYMMSKYIPGNQKQLTLENRIYIEKELNKGTSFKDIARLFLLFGGIIVPAKQRTRFSGNAVAKVDVKHVNHYMAKLSHATHLGKNRFL